MDSVTFNGFNMNWCYSCNGLWLNSKTIIEILSRTNSNNSYFLEKLYDAHGEFNNRYCPDCREEKLLEYNIDGVLVDQCEKCKDIFFKEGELNKIAPNVKKEQRDDLNYEDLPYSPLDYFNIEIDEKIQDDRKVVGPWQSVLMFLIIIFVYVLVIFIT